MRLATQIDFLPGEPAPIAGKSRGVEFAEMPARQILNRCANERMPFRWTINPYRGCEFGCVYCYARYTHEFLELRDPMDFERRIFVKRKAAEVLEHSLAHTPVGHDAIAIGTATDPYQPAERHFGITRSLLEVFARIGGLRLSITTKSALVVRDLDLLQAIAERSQLQVNFSLITLNHRLQRLLEPRAPRPELRLRALATLAQAGIACEVLMMPMIAGLTDSPAGIERVMGAAKLAGARAVHWRTLFLKPAAAARFLPIVRERFPHLTERMEEFYGDAAYPPARYEQELGRIFDSARRKVGFNVEPEVRSAPATRPMPPIASQLSLGLRA